MRSDIPPYGASYADLLFEVSTRRYQQRATVLTTNKPFGEWNYNK
jgi:DNA replication protein DnaC